MRHAIGALTCLAMLPAGPMAAAQPSVEPSTVIRFSQQPVFPVGLYRVEEQLPPPVHEEESPRRRSRAA